jgi:hypothetical protein
MKICKKCGRSGMRFHRNASKKDGLASTCVECHSVASERWEKANVGRIRETARAWKANNKERVESLRRARHKENPEKRRAYQRSRLQSDPGFRLRRNLQNRIWMTVVKGGKSASTLELLGCTIPELRAHLESQFRPGMTWENYGPVWHIDHRRPCASFDLLDPAQQRECFRYTNLQPLFAEENIRKGDKCH